jgi:hypothetical protein
MLSFASKCKGGTGKHFLGQTQSNFSLSANHTQLISDITLTTLGMIKANKVTGNDRYLSYLPLSHGVSLFQAL